MTDYLKATLVVAAGVAVGSIVGQFMWLGIVRLIAGPVL